MASPPASAGVPRYFVTGAHGFIGRRVVHILAGSGAAVVAPYRTPQEYDPDLPGEHLRLDLMDAAATAEAMRGVDVVIHLAARAGGMRLQGSRHAEVFAANRAMTDHVLAAAARNGASRVYLASSAVVYAAGPNRPLPESAPQVSHESPSGYAWSKVCDEVVARWYHEAGAFDVVVGRFSNVYGPGAPAGTRSSTVIHDLVVKALQAAPAGDLEVWGDGSAVRSFVFVEDAARAVVAITQLGVAGEAYNVDSGEEISIGGLARLIRDGVDPSIRLQFDKRKPTGPAFRALDVSKLRTLGFRPAYTLQQGIDATVRHFAATRP